MILHLIKLNTVLFIYISPNGRFEYMLLVSLKKKTWKELI